MEEKMTEGQRAAMWQQRLKELEASDMTQKDWCKENSVAESTLRYWRRKLKSQDTALTPWIQIPENAAHAGSTTITISCPGAELSITDEADPALRSRLIKAMIGI